MPHAVLRGIRQLFKPSKECLELQHADSKQPGKPNSAKGMAARTSTAAQAATAEQQQLHADAGSNPAPEPCGLLNPELAAVLNPVVIYAYKATHLPDAPASWQQLDSLCDPVSLRAHWPPLVSSSQHYVMMCHHA